MRIDPIARPLRRAYGCGLSLLAVIWVACAPRAEAPEPASAPQRIPEAPVLDSNGTMDAGVDSGTSKAGGLASRTIELVVRKHAREIPSRCWDGARTAASDVLAKAHLKVGPDGRVNPVTVSSNDPTVSQCIEGVIREWVFPTSNGSTDIDIPFHLVRSAPSSP